MKPGLLSAEADESYPSLEMTSDLPEIPGDLHDGYGSRGRVNRSLTDVMAVIVTPGYDELLVVGGAGDLADDIVGLHLQVLVSSL